MKLNKEVTMVMAGGIVLMAATIYGTLQFCTDKFSENKQESQAIAKQVLSECDKVDSLVAKLVVLRDSPDREGITLPGTDMMATVGCVKSTEEKLVEFYTNSNGTGSVQ